MLCILLSIHDSYATITKKSNVLSDRNRGAPIPLFRQNIQRVPQQTRSCLVIKRRHRFCPVPSHKI